MMLQDSWASLSLVASIVIHKKKVSQHGDGCCNAVFLVYLLSRATCILAGVPYFPEVCLWQESRIVHISSIFWVH